MATVALNMIVKDEYRAVEEIVYSAIPYFDEINIIVSNKTVCNKFNKTKDDFADSDKVTYKWREWTDRFDEARNAVAAMNTTDYFFWVDADDYFDFSTIPELLQIAVDNNLDEIFLPYNYARDEQGNCIARHYRERLVKCGRGEWKGWVHETYIIPEPKVSHVMHSPEVIHQTTPDHAEVSGLRNHAILAKAYEATKDPRYLMYLGGSYFSLQDYEKCIALLMEFIPLSGNKDDIYRALCYISEAAYHLEKYPEAYEYATKATVQTPSYPMAYWLLAQYAADQKLWEDSLEWVRVAESKPDPKTLTVWDPTGRERAILVGAQAEFMLGHFNKALAWLRKIPNNKSAQELLEGFTEEADAEAFTILLPRITKFFNNKTELWNALCPDMQYDARLLSLRQLATKPKKWSDKSIVILCGEGYEEWGPDTLDKGMGGSEEAVIYLTRELAKLGWEVTVFGEAQLVEELQDGEWTRVNMWGTFEDGSTLNPIVKWRPWREIDNRDEFNVFVAWRTPKYLEPVNAKVKLVDIHDIIPAETLSKDPEVTHMVKSQYHADLYKDTAADIKIVGNGIVTEQFHGRK